MKKVSIIVPCYNAAHFLPQCLDTVSDQTFQNFQIICIDDGSTDQTPHILAEYAAKDRRIQIITQENQGISAARNAGLKIALGDYVAFVDADDWLEPDTFKTVLADHAEDIICFSYYRNFDKAEITKDLGIEGVFPAELVQRRIVGLIEEELSHLTSFDALITCWGKLYKRGSLAGILFRDLKDFGTWEDGIFNLEVLEKASTVRVINKPFYHYRKVSHATYTSSYKAGLYLKWGYKYNWISSFLKTHQKPEAYFLALQNRIAVTFLNLAFNEMNSSQSWDKKKQVLKQILEHPVYGRALENFSVKHVPHVWKIFYYFAKRRNVWMVTFMAYLIHRVANINSKK